MATRKDPASQGQAQAQTPPLKQPSDRINSLRSQSKKLSWRNSFKLGRGGRTPSFKQEAQAERAAQKPQRYAQIVSVYNGLTWEKLRDEVLLKRWPDEDFFQEPDRKKDQWVFETPGEFTEHDKRAIRRLVSTKNVQRPPSPEPESESE
ncbi:hypothetical protein PG996_003835 [Apiospora saccharicola]|uniref:Uncharacterized protein n=1 Tax=Apiospora saccharicola TaxID=335842 RepID=A0ABR1W2F2_9PEZI